jgi:hypothetical protein
MEFSSSTSTMNSEEQSKYVNQMNNTKEEFYNENKKNVVFKNKQKIECAKHVNQSMELAKMIQCTAVRIPNTNIIYYNYMIFKTYACDEVKEPVYRYIIQLIGSVLKEYDNFEFHVNLKTFTISAVHRYKNIIASIFDENQSFTTQMSRLCIYHTPSIIDTINKVLYSSIRDILPKATYHHKESDQLIEKLFENYN